MVFPVQADIIGLMQGVTKSLQPFAVAHGVTLSFKTEVSRIEILHHPEEILPAIVQLICRIITFTPQKHQVILIIPQIEQSDDHFTAIIQNTGVNLSVMGEIRSGIKYPVSTYGNDRSSMFKIRIPRPQPEPSLPRMDSRIDHSLIKPWYSEIRKRLTSHFSQPKHLEGFARQKSEQEGMFLKKVNAIIYYHLTQEGFNAECLAKKMALSRTQLFRKVKELTQMAPGQYIRLVRLQKAKEMLEKKELNVSEVAYRVGFISNSHFSRAFYRQFGINPSTLK